jgi:hypothetical protein
VVAKRRRNACGMRKDLAAGANGHGAAQLVTLWRQHSEISNDRTTLMNGHRGHASSTAVAFRDEVFWSGGSAEPRNGVEASAPATSCHCCACASPTEIGGAERRMPPSQPYPFCASSASTCSATARAPGNSRHSGLALYCSNTVLTKRATSSSPGRRSGVVGGCWRQHPAPR